MELEREDAHVPLLRRAWHLPAFSRAHAYLRRLSPGDRLIAGILGLLVIGTSLAGLYALERSVLVVQPAYGGVLTEGVVGTPRFINPLLALSDTDRDLTALTYAGLMKTANSTSGVAFDLASGYTVTNGGTVYTFTLAKGALWSDGVPVTADDVVFTIQKAQDPLLKSPALADWAGIKVEAVDARTVRFTLPKAYAPFLENTTLGILPKHLWQNVTDADFPFSTLQTNPVGAGPFVLQSLTRTSSGTITKATLRDNPHYVLGRPYLDGITFLFYGDESVLADALKKGSVESAYGIETHGRAHQVLTAPYARIFGVFFNPAQNPAFTHLEVRKALSVAIDRQKLVHDLLGGYATPAYGPIPAGSGIVATSTGQSGTTVTQARQILLDAGWTFKEASGWSKGGQTISVTLKTSNVPELRAIAGMIQSEWKQLGVPVSLELTEPTTLAAQVITPRNYGALYFGEVVGRSLDLFAFWDSAEKASPGLNIAEYSNPAVDSLLQKIRTTDTLEERHADLQKLSQTIAADYPAAFTHTPDFVYSVPNTLGGVQLVQIASPSDRFANVSKWYLYREAVWPFLAREKS